ncbi:MAG TPA: carboxypeptidase-like regulatory domain-containing protein [Flavobacterium sp.]|nr:carboxypeptidase-like regulatory domain-containing protein [Flavobacterium sp.]
MKKTLLIILLLPSFVFAQIVKGRVQDAQTNYPIEAADVFIDQTSIGTNSNSSGRFELDTKGAKQQLIINAFGYHQQTVSIENASNEYLIKLEPKAEELQEIVIDAALFTREQLLKTFKYFFLGDSTNGKKSTILNEDDLLLYYDKEQRMLVCESSKPIGVHNKNLGYNVIFYLNEAKITFRKQSINPEDYQQAFIFGHTSFIDLSKNEKEYRKQRNKTFEAAVNPFWLAFLNNTLKEQHYYFYVNGMVINLEEYFSTEPDGEDFKVTLIQEPKLKLFRSFEPLPFNVNKIVNRKEQKSFFHVVQKEIYINKNGFVLNPQAIVYGGYFGNLKIADMLPTNYQLQK